MEATLATSPVFSPKSRTSTKLPDDVTSLTSFNPFSDEDEHDQSSYALVTSLISRVKNTLSAPLSSSVAGAASNIPPPTTSPTAVGIHNEARRPSLQTTQTQSSSNSRASASDRRHPLIPSLAQAAPPLVSLTPAQSEFPLYNPELERSSSRNGGTFVPVSEANEVAFGTSIPGFPIQDDARSIKTTTSVQLPGSVSKVFRRIRGEGKCRGIPWGFVLKLPALQVYPATIGWTMAAVKNATTARVSLPLGEENITAEFVVCATLTRRVPLIALQVKYFVHVALPT